MVWTNLGKEKMFEEFFCTGSVDDTFRIVLCDGNYGTWNVSTINTADVSAATSLDDRLTGQGGSSGLVIVRDAVKNGLNFDVSSASSTDGSAVQAVLQISDNSDYRFSGAITNARYVVLVGAGAEGSDFDFSSGKNIYAWWDLGSDTTLPLGSTLSIIGLALQAN